MIFFWHKQKQFFLSFDRNDFWCSLSDPTLMGGHVWKIQMYEEFTFRKKILIFFVESWKTNNTMGKFYLKGFIWMVTP